MELNVIGSYTCHWKPVHHTLYDFSLLSYTLSLNTVDLVTIAYNKCCRNWEISNL